MLLITALLLYSVLTDEEREPQGGYRVKPEFEPR